MRRWWLAGFAAVLGAVLGGAGTAAAAELRTGIGFDYSYSQEDSGGDVKAATLFSQKYEIRYGTSLTTAYDFLGAVRLDLQNGWYMNQATTSRVAPTLELQTKGSQAAAKIAYEASISTTDAYLEAGEVTLYSTSLSADLEATPVLWPEVKLKYQRRSDFQDYSKESAADTFQFSTLKDIYGVRLEYNFKWNQTDDVLPARSGSAGTTWSAKATYREILLGGAEFELAYEINEAYSEERTRGVFTGDTWTFNQTLKTRVKNTLLIGPRMTLGLAWEYQFDQDLLALDYDYKLKNKFALDLRWDAFDSFKITSAARHETDLVSNPPGEEDERTQNDNFKAGFDYSAISWLRLSGKAELQSEGKILAKSGGSVDQVDQESYELIAKNRFGKFWDFTVVANTSTKRTDDWLTNRETRVKFDLKLKLFDLIVTPAYQVSRTSDWERGLDYPVSQKRVQDARIKFDYQMQLVDLFKATFSHEYGIKVDDNLDEVLNFERLLQFNENTRFAVVLAEIVSDLRLEGEIERRASDTEGDPDPQLVELSYSLKLDWKLRQLSVLSSIKYNDKGDTFDDVSFNAKAGWKGEQLEVTGEYQFDKIIKDITEPKNENRKLNIRLSYNF